MALLTDREVDDELASDWQKIREAHAVEDDADASAPKGDAKPEGEEPAAPAAADQAEKDKGDAAPADKDGADQPRDRAGRYKPAPKAPKGERQAAAPAKGEAEQQQPDAQQQPEGQQPPPRDLTRAPSTWKPTARAAWAALPEPVRAEIHRREADFMSGQSQLLPDASFGKAMRETVEPYRMLIESEGGTPEAAVQDLLRTAAVLRTGSVQSKYQVMANIAQRFGIDLRLFGGQPQQPSGQQPGSVPAQQQFRDPRVDTLLQHITTAEQQRQAREQRDTESTVTHWMNEADAKGNPKRPYVGDVIDEMAVLIPQLKAANPALTHAQALEAAYERAIWGNPEIRVLLQQEQQTATEAQRRAESQRRTGEARRAASVNVPRRASIPAAPPTGSMDETIAETARELGLIST